MENLIYTLLLLDEMSFELEFTGVSRWIAMNDTYILSNPEN